ncbi:hypothetical protein P7C70_g1803, partial [Phenoliferia sp. Uapishka_3]
MEGRKGVSLRKEIKFCHTLQASKYNTCVQAELRRDDDSVSQLRSLDSDVSLLATLVSYIVFDRPPTVAECLAEWNEPTRAPAGRWHELHTTVTLQHPQAAPNNPTQSEPGDETTGITFNKSDAYRNALKLQDDSFSFQASCPILPPPSPSYRRILGAQPHRAQPSQLSFDNSVVSRHGGGNGLDAEDDTQISYIGTLPNLTWDANSLKPLDGLPALFRSSHSKQSTLTILAVLVDIRMPTETLSGKLRAGWDLADKTGALLSLVLWDTTATAYCDVVRRGDVVWVEGIYLSKYNDRLQGNVSEKSSMQICYRTNVRTEDDEVYVFHEAHGEHLRAASKVLEQVHWFDKAYPRR